MTSDRQVKTDGRINKQTDKQALSDRRQTDTPTERQQKETKQQADKKTPTQKVSHTDRQTDSLFVCWLLNVPATG